NSVQFYLIAIPLLLIMSKFVKSLEEKAEFLASVPKREQWDNSIPSIVRREIALTVDQIKRLKEKHEEQFLRLLRTECYVNTDLTQLEQRIPRYAPYHFPEKEKFKQRLFEIEKERRNLSLKLEEKTQGLEDKLLSLINKHEQLDI
ncbi:hypothetical protein KAR91_06790, partial [Candidatus Pacearchaeota archaeon]|nr:hypothetical protein [Candidatus Pacearchaeota archaeon]